MERVDGDRQSLDVEVVAQYRIRSDRERDRRGVGETAGLNHDPPQSCAPSISLIEQLNLF